LTTAPDITADPISAAVAEIAEHRAAIDQAKGMLILLYGLDDDAVFAMLRWRSQNANVKLRALAEQLVSD
jgi:AmiR/NasT family two-component response regulator